MTRNGKIARLPQEIREKLNQRLHNGEPLNGLVVWLNRLEPVREVMEMYFGGTPIRKQNISEWRKGGLAEWLREKQAQLHLTNMRESASGLNQAIGGTEISGCFATLLATQMTELAGWLLNKETDPEKRWKRLCQVHKQISRMRRDDYRGIKSMIVRKRWEQETEQEEEDDNTPAKWMTPEEKAATIRQIYMRDTEEDRELLRKASWKGWLPKCKQEAYARIFGELSDEEVEEEEEIVRGEGQGI